MQATFPPSVCVKKGGFEGKSKTLFLNKDPGHHHLASFYTLSPPNLHSIFMSFPPPFLAVFVLGRRGRQNQHVSHFMAPF